MHISIIIKKIIKYFTHLKFVFYEIVEYYSFLILQFDCHNCFKITLCSKLYKSISETSRRLQIY